MVLLLAMAGAAVAQDTPPLTLDAAIRLALDASLDRLAASHAAEATRAGVRVAGQRTNPDLSVEVATKDTPHHAATLSFPLEPGGKRGRRIELAEASALTADAELGRTELEVRTEVRNAFYDYASALETAAVRADQADLARRLRDAAQARFEAGEAPRLEVVQSDLAVAQAETDADAAQGAVIASRAVLAALLGWSDPSTLRIADAIGDEPLPDAPALVERALASSVELLRLERAVAEQSSRLALARAEQVPDLSLDAGVDHDAEPEFLWGWRAGLEVGLPIFHHHGGEVVVEQLTLAERQVELDAAKRRVSAEIERQHALAAAAQRSALRYRDQVMPRAAEVERMAEDSYRSGQSGLVELITALRQVRDTQLQAIEAKRGYERALGDLEQAMGVPLS
jgi:cobalt-zinc-cadmium efflux system outer membrane protein